jgi:hypothetical protein
VRARAVRGFRSCFPRAAQVSVCNWEAILAGSDLVVEVTDDDRIVVRTREAVHVLRMPVPREILRLAAVHNAPEASVRMYASLLLQRWGYSQPPSPEERHAVICALWQAIRRCAESKCG